MSAINWLLLTLGDAFQWIWHEALGGIGAFLTHINDLINPALAALFTWITRPIDAVGQVLLAPVAVMPGWLSNTIISAITGVLLLLIYKYTSNQKAIGRVKDNIKANMLALKLFKDELPVVFRAQAHVLLGALKLLRYSLFPLMVMLVPVMLLLGQMGVWYQWRPLRVGESALVTMKCTPTDNSPMPNVKLAPNPAADVLIGPVRIPSKQEIHWKIRANQPGHHKLVFHIGDQQATKDLVIGKGLTRISTQRAGPNWLAIIIHPIERPFASNDPVSSIAIDYPDRMSYTSGSDWWVAYFFVASMIFALILKPFLNVRI